MRAGFVAVVGRPNVGKSTLVNALVGQKVSIVTDKPQTTRGIVRGVRTTEDTQIVFTDTPGFHKPRTLLGQRLNRMVADSVEGVDAVLLVVDAAAGVGRGDAFVAARHVTPLRAAKVCAVNKVDRIGHAQVLPQLQAAAALSELDHIVPVSARTGDGLDELVRVLEEAMPEGDPLYPSGESTDQPVEFRVSELVREQALALTREEVPHSIAVRVEELEESEDLVRVSCQLLVERESQKGIVIGRGGTMLKQIGTMARGELEALFGRRVFLELRVKVWSEWQRDASALTRLGY